MWVYSVMFTFNNFKFIGFFVLCGECNWNYWPQGTKEVISFSKLKSYQMCGIFIHSEGGMC